MAGHKFTKEERDAFWRLFYKYRDTGLSVVKSWQGASQEAWRNCQSAPSWSAFKLWYREAVMSPEEAEPPVDPKPPVGPIKASDSRRDTSKPPVGPETPDAMQEYCRRLELLVRLYRFRRETDIDAVCDLLFSEIK